MISSSVFSEKPTPPSAFNFEVIIIVIVWNQMIAIPGSI